VGPPGDLTRPRRLDTSQDAHLRSDHDGGHAIAPCASQGTDVTLSVRPSTRWPRLPDPRRRRAPSRDALKVWSRINTDGSRRAMSTPTATARLGTANDGAPVVSMNKIGTPRRETTVTANGMRSLTPTIDRRTIALSVSGGPMKRERRPLWTGLKQRVISRRIAGKRSSDLSRWRRRSTGSRVSRPLNIQGATPLSRGVRL
jgi:hypothetical protein